VYVGVRPPGGKPELWDAAGWAESGPRGKVEVIVGLRAAMAWAVKHRALRGTPPQDLDRYVESTDRYLAAAEQSDRPTVEFSVLEIAAASVTAGTAEGPPTTEEPGAG
jgi:hypothetical protein